MIKLNIDISALTEIAAILGALNPAMNRAAQELATQTYAHIQELAQERLNSRRELYIKSLHINPEDTGDANSSCFIISLDAKARFIDDGMPARNMLSDLLKNAETNQKTGNRYKVIPFHYEAGPGSSPQAQQDIISTVKSAMKSQGIPISKIEVDSSGKPLMGRLHSIDMSGNHPLRSGVGPWQGLGGMGEPIQGWSQGAQSGTGKGGTPVTKGVKVYQKLNKETGKIQRDIVSFRVASETHRQDGGRWEHPGLLPEHFMEEGLEWAKNKFEKDIFPEVMGRLIGKIT